MTIDTDGNLWVAVFGGGCVLHVDPRRKDALLEEIKLPANQITSAAWGGPNLDELYITSADQDIKTPKGEKSGGLFRVTGLKAKGFPMVPVKLN